MLAASTRLRWRESVSELSMQAQSQLRSAAEVR